MSLHHQQQSLQQQQNFLLPPLPPSPPLSNTENFIQGPAVMASSESTSGHHRGSVDGLGLSNCSTQLELSTASVHPTPPEKHMDPSRPITHLDVMGSMAPPPPQFTHHPSSQDSASAAMAMGYAAAGLSHPRQQTPIDAHRHAAESALQVGALGGPGANSGQGSGAFGAPDTHEMLENLKLFLATAPSTWDPDQVIKHFPLPSGETVSCVLWSNLFHITGTDIVRSLTFRFAAFGRPVKNMKKFEEGVFSDLRNLKPGIDATLEEPRSEFLEFLFKANCIRTQKKQKVFYWFSVPHDRLFMDALERDLKRESLGIEPTTAALHPMPLAATIELAKQQCLLSIPKGPADPWVTDYMADSNQVPTPGLMNPLRRSESVDDKPNHTNPAPPAMSYPGSLTSSPSMSHANINSIVGSPALDASHVPGMVNGADEFQLAANANGSSAMFNPVFSLFEGSPKYKQRRRAQSLLSNGRSANRGSVPTEMAAGTGGGMLVHPSVSASPSASSGQSDSEAPRLHICNFDACGKKFKRFEHLRRHMRCHTGERPYVCPLEGCSKGFSRSDNLACHMKVHGFTPEQIAASRSPTPNLHAANTSQNGAPSRHQTPASMLSESPEMAHLHPPSQSNTQNAAFFQEAQHNDSHNFVTYPNDNNHFFHANPQHPNHHQIQNPHLAQQYPQAPQRLQQPNPLPSFMVFPPNHPSSKHHAQQLPSLIVPQYQNQAPPAPQQQTQQQPHPYTQSQMMPPPTYPHQPNATGAPPPPVNVNNMGQNPWAPNANGGDVSFTLPPLTPSGLSPYLTTSHSGAYPLGMPTVF